MIQVRSFGREPAFSRELVWPLFATEVTDEWCGTYMHLSLFEAFAELRVEGLKDWY